MQEVQEYTRIQQAQEAQEYINTVREMTSDGLENNSREEAALWAPPLVVTGTQHGNRRRSGGTTGPRSYPSS